MKYLLILFLIPLLIIPAFAQTNSQTLQTEKGTLDVKLAYDDIMPGDQTKLHIDFINPQNKKIQEHIDYTIIVSKDGKEVFGPIPLTHTSLGSVNIPVEFIDSGVYSVELGIEGILFQPIPLEKVSFDVTVGETVVQPPPTNDKDNGCLIATAAFGSELSPQVQQLRELRDNTILATQSGTAFMTTFNQFYYSFSPIIADYEREQPIFKEAVKISLTPMLTSLSILNHVNIDSEQEMVGYGIGIILMNIGMYIGIPVFGIFKLYQFKRK
ncbi:CFI-box-CTERM domain-containing protein [Nitrosarchaeum koreense]|uniref:Copper binding protein, plastocyanin/azurin family n=1 Tax=Nitrosarchaeum koreense MY1 TaxID=1001994 RepID=F9CZC4_9ARCH|nr:CFI-box-CTERM domain-containing protein [Nitrosarchaeum koreense]EGP94513.1 Copper binding protein, plastocyanin/azurin family [Nitrosarchaeum koreense MY1]